MIMKPAHTIGSLTLCIFTSKRKRNMSNHFDPIDPDVDVPKRSEGEEEEEARLQATRISNAMAFPMVFKAALELGVFDAISAAGEGAWLSPSEIARGLPTKPTNPHASVMLDRMLRVLTSYSVLKCRTVRTGENGQTGETQRVYAAEPVCRYFLNNDGHTGSLGSLFMLHLSDVMLKTWSHLKDIIQEGRDAFSSAHGLRLFEYIGGNEQFNQLFNRAMSESTAVFMKNVLEVYGGFEDVNVLVDVGGGFGTVLGIITSKYPKIRGINFDLADVLANAPSYHGVEHVTGNMFVDVPKGDAIFMKRILHDWTNEDCMKILINCWKALSENGKVIIVEMIAPDEPKSGDVYSNVTFDYDMLMLSQCSGGKERTKLEFQELAAASGFSHCKFVCFACPFWVIEFHKTTNA